MLWVIALLGVLLVILGEFPCMVTNLRLPKREKLPSDLKLLIQRARAGSNNYFSYEGSRRDALKILVRDFPHRPETRTALREAILTDVDYSVRNLARDLESQLAKKDNK